MTWIKLDDKCPRHPKVAALSDRAFRWWIHTLCYASEFRTDGLIPASFLRTIPAKIRAELVTAGLWHVQADEALHIHDYLEHQRSRAEIDGERERSKQRRTGGQPLDDRRSTAGQTDERPANDRDQKQKQIQRADTETDPPSKNEGGGRAPGLIRTSLEFEKELRWNAFVGARLKVPHKLHRDFSAALGGDNPEADLQAWYRAVDLELETSREPIVPDVWKWLEARFKPWAMNRGADDMLAKWAAGASKHGA